MKVGFIGAGNVTATIGRHLINAGRTIVVSNSRGPETLGKFVAELGPGAIAGTKQQAAKCDIVILATRWVNVPEALKGIGVDEYCWMRLTRIWILNLTPVWRASRGRGPR